MALLFMDGFDYYSDDQIVDLRGKWFAGSGAGMKSVTGRDGTGKALAMTTGTGDSVYTGVPDLETYYIAFGFKMVSDATGDRPFFQTYNNREITSTQMQLRIRGPEDTIEAVRGAVTIIAESTNTIAFDTWMYMEIFGQVANSGGRLEIRIDGTSVNWIDFTGDTNSFASLNIITMVRLMGAAEDFHFDDFIIMDNTGGRLDGFQGDLKIETIYPDGVGNDSAWTPSAGANWAAVDDVIPDDDATYVEATAVATEDRHTFANLVSTPAVVHAVAVNLFAKRTEFGNRLIRALAFDGTTEGQGADKGPTFEEYTWHQHIFEDHPTSAAVWTGSEVDSGEFGYRIES